MLFGGIRVFAQGLRWGTACSCPGLARDVTQLTDSLIIDCLLSALQPQLTRMQHTEGRPKKTSQSSSARQNFKGLTETTTAAGTPL